jgi:hypothetical protein
MRGIFLLAVIVAALSGASYAGARFTAGKVTGPNPPGLGPPSSRFEFKGIGALRGQPRGWVIAYPAARQFGPQGAEIYVSPVGSLLGVRPADLGQRLESSRATEP